MFKRVLVAAAVAGAFAAPAFAEVAISGSAEMDFFYRTNNTPNGDGKLLEEVAIVINLDGSDKLDTGDTLKWRLAQKVATDYRYDSFGKREAWIGYAGSWGELRFGNQFTNTYLQMDWPYGVKGSGNLWADLGAYSVNWGDAVSYFSPNWGGFSFAAQYKLGSQDDATNTNGYDISGGYGNDVFNIDGGYQVHNDQLVGTFAVGGNGQVTGDLVAADAKTELGHIGGRVRFGAFNIRAAYKANKWEKGSDDVKLNQYLIGGGYGFGKNNITLSYQHLDGAELNGNSVGSDIDQLAFQWDYSLSKNTGAFLQARYQKFDDASKSKLPSWAIDGWNGKDDNVSRILVGTWTGF
ncbi:Chitoporin [Andreprevotia sp. IGB-42]|uniref:porin n=1 Tax=Andreprevotia sp. IGB-42 TaxID=2497473 RepID=UPI0013571DC0|nr:porin [Andreprevotia sp. IGB-42]KAF0815194.1 Chitoporin [Andreprevotia sp. IGB-42]